MSIRTFIFCDICNLQGVRAIEYRRSPREDGRTGRRISDGRIWFDGNLAEAIDSGWTTDVDGQHICPVCSNYTH